MRPFLNILTSVNAKLLIDISKLFPIFLPPQVLDASIRLLQLPTDETDADDEHFIDVEDTPGYQAAFCQLAMAGKKEFDPLAGRYFVALEVGTSSYAVHTGFMLCTTLAAIRLVSAQLRKRDRPIDRSTDRRLLRHSFPF